VHLSHARSLIVDATRRASRAVNTTTVPRNNPLSLPGFDRAIQ
jgi:hypothetical protein